MADQEAPQACANGCGHQLRTVEEIGDWIHTLEGKLTVREWSAKPEIWDEGHCGLSHAELRQRVELAGGIGCEHALRAITLPSRATHLSNGVHRWAIATELGVPAVPVEMRHQPVETPYAWEP